MELFMLRQSIIVSDPMPAKQFTTDEASKIGEKIGIDWKTCKFDVEQFRMGLDVELEHGSRDPQTDVTHSDPVLTGKVAWAHLKEFPDYYTRLKKMEKEADAYWKKKLTAKKK